MWPVTIQSSYSEENRFRKQTLKLFSTDIRPFTCEFLGTELSLNFASLYGENRPFERGNVLKYFLIGYVYRDWLKAYLQTSICDGINISATQL